VRSHGPRQALRGGGEFATEGQVTAELRFAAFSTNVYDEARAGGRGPSAAEVTASSVLQRAIAPAVLVQQYPKSSIDIYVHVLADDGSAVQAAVCAASLALANAGIQCCGLVAAASVGLVQGGSAAAAAELRVDLTAAEQQVATASVSVAMLPALVRVSSVEHAGVMAPKDVSKALALAAQATAVMHSVMKQALLEDAAAVE